MNSLFMSNFGYNPIVLNNMQDTNDLSQLGEIQGLIYSIQNIIQTKLHDSPHISKRYAMELILKLKAIYNYRWETGNTQSKMLIPGPDRNFFISESPYSVIQKARQFVAIHSIEFKETIISVEEIKTVEEIESEAEVNSIPVQNEEEGERKFKNLRKLAQKVLEKWRSGKNKLGRLRGSYNASKFINQSFVLVVPLNTIQHPSPYRVT